MRRIFILSLMTVAWVGFAPAQGTGKRQTDAEIEKEILQLEYERDEARQKGDMKTLGRILADDYFYIGVRGNVRTKPIALTTMRPGSLRFTPSRRTIFSSRFTETRF